MGDNDNDLENIIIGCLGESSVGKTYLTRKYVHDNTLKDFRGFRAYYFKYIILNL